MATLIKAYTLSECMDAAVAEIKKLEARGMKNLIFCEDRLTMIAERAIVNALGGSFFTSVSTFGRFLKSDAKLIGKQGSVMAIANIISRLHAEKKLKCFKPTSSDTGNARSVYETLAQFSAGRIGSEELFESAASLENDALKGKLEDLALIFQEYESFLKENGFIDESKYLSLLPDCLRKTRDIGKTNVIFLGYTAFTAQAAETIRAAAECAADVVGIFCADKEAFYTSSAADRFLNVCGEFGKVEIKEWYVPLGGEAEKLRVSLFDPEKLTGQKMNTDKIAVFEGADRTEEAAIVAANIKKLLIENKNLRYRDIAVLLPDTAAYEMPLKKAFFEYGVSYFFDEKRSLKAHPLSEFILSAFEMVKENFLPATVQAFAQNVFFGESAEYRNYLLKFANYRGGADKPIKEGDAVNAFDKTKLESGYERIKKATKNIKRQGYGREHCYAIRKLTEDFSVKETLEKLADDVNDPAIKGYLGQIFTALDRVLYEAELLLGDVSMKLQDFLSVFSDGLDATEISLIPLKTDAVFVGDIIDSRIEKVRALFALGLDDSVPRMGRDSALIADKDIERLAAVKTVVEPTVAEVNLRNRENFCLNLCTFTDFLFLSYPRASGGDTPTLCEVFRYVQGAFADVNGAPIFAKKEADELYACSSVPPAVRRLLVEKSKFESGVEDTRKSYSSLYAALVEAGVTDHVSAMERAKRSDFIARGKELFLGNGKISPTLLEKYFTCPFGNFVEKGLRLKEREESVVLAFDNGNFIHAVLEKVTQKMDEFSSEADVKAYARKVGEELSQSDNVYLAQRDTAAGTYATNNLIREGEEVAAAVYRQLKNSEFKVDAVEKEVSTELFFGKIDRVDVSDKFIRIVDYKTGGISDSATAYYMGTKVQMQLYMSAVQGDKIPAGIFYFPASYDYASTDDGRFRMKGFLNGSLDALRAGDKNLTEDTQSEYFAAALVNTKKQTHVMEEKDFCDFLGYAELIAAQGKKEMEDGFVAPSPTGNACQYCKMGGMCGFNKEVGETRVCGTVSPQAIAGIVREKKGN